MNAAYNQTGWGARMAEALVGTQQRTSVSMLVSLNGTNFFQVDDDGIDRSGRSGRA